jgi:hypothetical protein
VSTDIHMYLEVRDHDTAPWRKIDEIFDYQYYDPSRPTELRTGGEPGTEDYWEYVSNPSKTDHPYDDRNYQLFAALADVRNGVGFAGVLTGNKVTPIAEPRGIPTDLSPELQKIWDEGGDHTPTWLMLYEVLAYDWDQPYIYIGVVSVKQYEKLKDGIVPESWSGGISGPGIVTYLAEEYESLKAAGQLPDKVEGEYANSGKFFDAQIYIQTSWSVPGGLRSAIGTTWFSMLAGVGENYDHDNTRFVFWFDS